MHLSGSKINHKIIVRRRDIKENKLRIKNEDPNFFYIYLNYQKI